MSVNDMDFQGHPAAYFAVVLHQSPIARCSLVSYLVYPFIEGSFLSAEDVLGNIILQTIIA